MNTLIGQNKYVAGSELTIADLSVLASTTVLEIDNYQDLSDAPNVKAWLTRVKQLPYYEEVNGGVADIFRNLAKSKQNK